MRRNQALGIIRILLAAVLGTSITHLSGEILKNSKGETVRYAGIYGRSPVDLPRLHFRRVQTRAVWCATTQNLDFPRCADAAEFKKHFSGVVALLRKYNCNVLIFQVRGNADAVYLSRYNPFSAWISGKAGRTLGDFDPLPYMVQLCHRNGIEFHAWLNPYRIVSSTKLTREKYLETLPARHIARLRPDLVIAGRNRNGTLSLQFDPGRPEVINHLLHTVDEIIARAPVDAIHLDDYFYPYTPLPPGADAYSYRNFNPGKLSLEDWRRSNVNRLVMQLSRFCRTRRVRFGISPFGIWANAKEVKGGSPTGGVQSRNELYADSLLWMQQGWLDYIIPQIYWSFDHPKAAYAAVTDWWIKAARRYPRTRLLIGHGLYRISGLELYNQLRYNSVHPEISGEALFALRHLREKRFSDSLKKCWPTSVPAMK